MKLWLITQKDATGYDTFDSAVVAATTEAEARGIHPASTWGGFSTDRWSDDYPTWARSPESVKAECIGYAIEGTEGGTVICASFNQG